MYHGGGLGLTFPVSDTISKQNGSGGVYGVLGENRLHNEPLWGGSPGIQTAKPLNKYPYIPSMEKQNAQS